MSNRTFTMIKPDATSKGHTGAILDQIIKAGFSVKALKWTKLTPGQAGEFYAIHKERPFFAGLVEFITSGPVVATVWEGDGVIAAARKLIGATNPLTAEPGTIRGDLGINIGRNIIHGSDALETAQTEIALWFKDEELVTWGPQLTPWLHE